MVVLMSALASISMQRHWKGRLGKDIFWKPRVPGDLAKKGEWGSGEGDTAETQEKYVHWA